MTIIYPNIKHRSEMLNRCACSLLLIDSDAFDFEYGTAMMRMNEGLDVSHIVEAEGQC